MLTVAQPPNRSCQLPNRSFEPPFTHTQFAKGLLEELQDASQLGQRGEGWTVAQFVALGLVVLPPFHSTVISVGMWMLVFVSWSACVPMVLGQQL